jgi:hypothetical protein
MTAWRKWRVRANILRKARARVPNPLDSKQLSLLGRWYNAIVVDYRVAARRHRPERDSLEKYATVMAKRAQRYLQRAALFAGRHE